MGYIVYGAGSNLKNNITVIRSMIDVDYIVDKKAEEQDMSIHGIKIKPVSMLPPKNGAGQKIIVSVSDRVAVSEIKEILLELGYCENRDFFYMDKIFTHAFELPGRVSGYVELPENIMSIKTFDPTSRLIDVDSEEYLLRGIVYDYAEYYRALAETYKKSELLRKAIIQTDVVEDIWGMPYALLLKHRRIANVSYCFEWSPATFVDYTKFMLELICNLTKNGMGLNDGHAMNATIHEGRFVFIDFGALKQGYTWPCVLLEFVNTHIIPCVLIAKGEIDKAYLYMKNMGLTYTYRDIMGYLSIDELRSFRTLYDRAIETTDEDGIYAFIDACKAYLQTQVVIKDNSQWDGYQDDEWAWSNKRADWSQKMIAVASFLDKASANSVIDLAGNMGWYGCYCRDKYKTVTILDLDYNCIDNLWQRVKSEKMTNVLPIYMSVCAPTLDYYRDEMIGASGIYPWRKSACNRFKSDVVIALAIIHHLVFRQQLTFEEIVAAFDKFSNRYLIIEFIEREDQYITDFNLIGFDWYTRENFEAELVKSYRILEVGQSTPLETRKIYFCEKRGK